MILRNLQPNAQEMAGAQMNGMGVFNLKWVAIILLLAFEIILICARYHNQTVLMSKQEDYRIVDCTVAENEEKYRLYITIESLNGQEQTIEVYMNGLQLQREATEMAYLLPAYETAVVTYVIDKEDVGDSVTLSLDTYEPQEWEVELP